LAVIRTLFQQVLRQGKLVLAAVVILAVKLAVLRALRAVAAVLVEPLGMVVVAAVVEAFAMPQVMRAFVVAVAVAVALLSLYLVVAVLLLFSLALGAGAAELVFMGKALAVMVAVPEVAVKVEVAALMLVVLMVERMAAAVLGGVLTTKVVRVIHQRTWAVMVMEAQSELSGVLAGNAAHHRSHQPMLALNFLD
jgi:hypothetical protein